jgi:hypothetical protein
VIKNVIVEDNPSKSRLGKVLLNRAKSVAGGNVAGVVGAAAVIAMIEAVGWVMEDGTWVKFKEPKPDDDCSTCTYYWWTDLVLPQKQPTYKGACPNSYSQGAYTYKLKSPGHIINSLDSVTCLYYSEQYPDYRNWDRTFTTTRHPNPNPQPAPEKEKVTITDKDVGGIATGDYVDPVDDSQNIDDKKYKPVVVTAYEHDPSGVGEDIANEIDERIKTAPPTEDGKPAPKGHPKYANPPEPDKKTNDRSWEDDTANDAEGDTTPVVDPETGEPTGGQKISITFPVFCTWAHSVCDWYDDWTKTDTIFKEQVEKERTFWQKVTDFFSWVKDDSFDSDTELEFNDPTNDVTDTNISFSSQCPAPIVLADFSYHGISQNWQVDFTGWCNVFSSIFKPIVIAMASFSAVLIVSGVRENG